MRTIFTKESQPIHADDAAKAARAFANGNIVNQRGFPGASGGSSSDNLVERQIAAWIARNPQPAATLD